MFLLYFLYWLSYLNNLYGHDFYSKEYIEENLNMLVTIWHFFGWPV